MKKLKTKLFYTIDAYCDFIKDNEENPNIEIISVSVLFQKTILLTYRGEEN